MRSPLIIVRIFAIETIAMKFVRTVEISAALAGFAIIAVVAASPAYADPPPAAAPAASASPAAKKPLHHRIRKALAKIIPDRVERDIEFKTASAEFPDFCKHWEQDLHDREVNNLSKLEFVPKEGYETATYTGYGKIAECESHQSRDGYSIGRITYEEFVYYIAGKSQDEALHTPPKILSDTHTTEIFRWDNGKWFY
jgi:hypothetical protein